MDDADEDSASARPRGRLIAVVGPSGAGKDTLMAAAAASRPDLVWARRAITRPATAGGEPFEGVDEAEFARRRAAGAFAIWWEAHGLSYGVPMSALTAAKAGATVMFNGSRAALDAARAVFPALEVVLVTAPPEILARRLALRGRESEAEIARRLARSVDPSPGAADGAAAGTAAGSAAMRVVANDGDLETGAARFLAALSLSGESAR